MVKHILKNGKEIKDLSGHIIKKSDNPTIHNLVKGESQWMKKK